MIVWLEEVGVCTAKVFFIMVAKRIACIYWSDILRKKTPSVALLTLMVYMNIIFSLFLFTADSAVYLCTIVCIVFLFIGLECWALKNGGERGNSSTKKAMFLSLQSMMPVFFVLDSAYALRSDS